MGAILATLAAEGEHYSDLFWMIRGMESRGGQAVFGWKRAVGNRSLNAKGNGREKAQKTQRGQPQPKKLNHGFHGFHG
jgi:hypothetical protein